MKTPEGIKKGLECCTAHMPAHDDCPYKVARIPFDVMCKDGLMEDALALIHQLGAKLADVEKDRDEWQRRAEAAERDLCTISDKYKICDGCKHDCGNGIMDCGMTLCDRDNLYDWRGPCAENGGDDHG